MAEGNETPGGESGPAGRRSEGDLFSERRARRAAESGEVALTRRAEAAEATVQTLERHVSSLQQRLREAEDEQARMAELIDAEKAAALEREHELRRVKQREYAEQQLRVEAEERLTGLDRESHAESEQLSRRLSASEDDTRELAGRLESLQRQLAEAEQAAAAERAAVRRAEHELQARLREEMARPAAGWLNWVRRPAWAMSLAAVIFMGALGVGIGIGSKSYIYETEALATKPPSPGLPVQPGSAVGDLQALERNDELYADFDVLDDLQVQDDVTANP